MSMLNERNLFFKTLGFLITGFLKNIFYAIVVTFEFPADFLRKSKLSHVFHVAEVNEDSANVEDYIFNTHESLLFLLNSCKF